MATGLMTLAYLGEMAIVFNLAYLELSKERYLKPPKEDADALRAEIAAEDHGAMDRSNWLRETTKVRDRLESMKSGSTKDRQKAWYVSRSSNELTTFDWWASRGYNFFNDEWDKKVCQRATIIGALLLVLITVLDQMDFGAKKLENRYLIMATSLVLAALVWLGHILHHQISRLGILGGIFLTVTGVAAAFISVPGDFPPQMSITFWWYFFSFFLLSLLAPVGCILLGRSLRSKFNECIFDAKNEFEAIKAEAIRLPKNGA